MLTYWCGIAGGEDAYNACNNPFNPGAAGVPYANFTGFQYARTGLGFGSVLLYGGVGTGVVPDRREYIQVPLKQVLQNGKKYCGRMYVNASNECSICADRIGMYASSAVLPCNQAFPMPQYIAPLNFTPQIQNPLGQLLSDTLNWMEVSGVFTSVGGEQAIVIGNFFDDAHTTISTVYPNSWNTLTYVYIDDVSLEEVHDAQCIHDTTLCSPDSLILGANVNEAAEYTWSPSTGLSCTSCPNPKSFVNQTTTYTLTKKQCKVTTTDQVTITVKNDCGLVNIPNVFTPNEDGVNDAFVVNLPLGYYFTDFMVYNRWGNVIYQTELHTKSVIAWDGHTTSGEKVSDGTYFYTIRYTNAEGNIVEKRGCASLFR